MKLSDVVLPVRFAIRPTEEEIRHRLHHLLPSYDSLPIVDEPRVLASVLDVRSEDRWGGLLHLQNDLVVFVASLEQSHPTVRPDTTHTDNLHREVDDTIATDDRLALGWERLNVGRVLVLKALADGIVFTADEHRGDCLETPRPVNNLRQSRDGPFVCPVAGF